MGWRMRKPPRRNLGKTPEPEKPVVLGPSGKPKRGGVPYVPSPPEFVEWHKTNPSLSRELALWRVRAKVNAIARPQYDGRPLIHIPSDPMRRRDKDEFLNWLEQNPVLAREWAFYAFREHYRPQYALHQARVALRSLSDDRPETKDYQQGTCGGN